MYKQIADEYKPKPTLLKNCIWAFVVGGLICVIGQIVSNILAHYGLDGNDGASLTSVVMIFLGALLTGLGVYDEIGKRAGAGSIIPITGFANSMVAPAMEFKREGFVFGVGAKLFTIAGPVLVYGITASFIIGLIKFIVR
ncbi:MAG: stage V sporulation protein AC [Peptococcaceae bacterium]|nr:stage V sporulation protein AC [Peptococcaceae bacterium]